MNTTWQCPNDVSPALWKPSPVQWCASPDNLDVHGRILKTLVYTHDQQDLHANPWINEMERIGYLYVVPIICGLGVLLNLFVIVVLCRRGFQGPSVVLLKGLAIADIVTTAVTLPFGFVYCILCPFNHDGYTQLVYQIYIYAPITNMSETLSAWTTVLLATERLVSVRTVAVVKYQECGKIYLALGGAILGAVLLNIPYFYAFDIAPVGTLCFEKVFSDFGSSVSFAVFSWTRAMLSQFLPLVYLCVVNCLLLFHVGRSVERCRKFALLSNQVRRDKAQTRMTAMLVGTVVLFIAGHVPVAFAYTSIFQSVFGHHKVPSEFYSSYRVVTHSVALLSYTLDFVVYCVFNSHFRNAIASMFVRSKKVSDSHTPVPTVINVRPSFVNNKVVPLPPVKMSLSGFPNKNVQN